MSYRVEVLNRKTGETIAFRLADNFHQAINLAAHLQTELADAIKRVGGMKKVLFFVGHCDTKSELDPNWPA